MKKRICAFLCALLMLANFACVASATIMVEDENGIHYDTDEIVTTTQPGPVAAAAGKVLNAVSDFWHRFGVVTVIVLLLVAIVVAIVISEYERQKKEKRPPQPTSKKKKK